MKAVPEELDVDALIEAAFDCWGLHVETAAYAPVGAGSYHWDVVSVDGTRVFATVDDLDRKAWLGDTRDEAFDGLRNAFAAAAALREHGHEFVVAPLRAADGEPLHRLDSRYTLALFPHVQGAAATWGPYEREDERRAVVALLADLHEAPLAFAGGVAEAGLSIPGRRHLDAALAERAIPWKGGPFAEPARAAIDAAADELAELLALADRLAAEARRQGAASVLTHGEPHRANILRTETGPVLVDWDTVAAAPPERDLWLVLEAGTDAAALYEETTGRAVNASALDFFRLTWDLKDLAEYLNVLRAPHEENEDTLWQYESLAGCGAIREEWQTLLA